MLPKIYADPELNKQRLGELIDLIGTIGFRQDTHKAQDLIASTYHGWRNKGGLYEDKAGFCKSATIAEIKNNNYVLMPGRYVGTEEEADDGIPFDEKMKVLTSKLAEQFAKGNELEKTIRKNLKGIGYEF